MAEIWLKPTSSSSTVLYTGNTAVTVTIPGATAETTLRSYACRAAATLNGNYYTCQGQGIWCSSDNGATWTQVFTPPGLIATNNGRIGLFNITIDGTNYICGAYNTSSNDWRMFRSSDGINWTVGATQTLGTNDVSRMEVINNKVATLNYSGTIGHLYEWDFKNLIVTEQTPFPSQVLIETTCLAVVRSDPVLDLGLYIAGSTSGTPATTESVLMYIDEDTRVRTIISTTLGVAVDTTARGSAFYDYVNRNLIYIYKASGSGLRAAITNNTKTAWLDGTGILPTNLQTDTNATLTQIIQEPSGPIQMYVSNSGGSWDSYAFTATAYSRTFTPYYSGIGSTLDYGPAMQTNNLTTSKSNNQWGIADTVQFQPTILNTALFVEYNNVNLSYKLKLPKFYDIVRVNTYYGDPESGFVDNPVTISSSSAGTVSNNTVTLTDVSGYTDFNLNWNIGLDFPLATAFNLAGDLDVDASKARNNERVSLLAGVNYSF